MKSREESLSALSSHPGAILEKVHDTINRKEFAGLVRRVLKGDQDAVAILREMYGGQGWMLDDVIESVIETGAALSEDKQEKTR